MLPFIFFFSFFQVFQNKNIFLPFKKMTIEYLNESKSIADFIDFNIYTNISIGSPRKNVANFILKSNSLFYYANFLIQYHSTPEYNQIQEEIKNSIDIFYVILNSSSYVKVDDYASIGSDLFYFNDITGKESSYRLEFNFKPGSTKDKLCGQLDLTSEPLYDEYNKYFFQVLKANEAIDEYYITFFYGEYNYEDDSNYFNDDYNNILGNLIIGESPHELYPDKYKEDDEIKINGKFELYINELKLNQNFSNYTEKDISVNVKFNTEFIKGSLTFKYEIENIFFNELIEKNLCRSENVEENIYISQDTVYSCENSEIVREKIKRFPTLYFQIKPDNLTFLFNYKELFKLHHDRLYFLIYFKGGSLMWEIGELFLRKYTTSFNYDSRTISFYRSQVDDINQKTDIQPGPEPDPTDPEPTDPEPTDPEPTDPEPTDPVPTDPDSTEPDTSDPINPSTEPKDDSTDSLNVRLIVEIVMGVILFISCVIIFFFIIRWKKTRKKRADELKDDDYDYSPKVN